MAKHAKLTPHSPHFFRVILPQILQNGTLELPRQFVNLNWKHLSKHAHLKLPNGEKTKMELMMRNGKAWLAKGWRGFVERYKIKCWYFLVFGYEGRSRFKVQIFDLSTSEIEYPRATQENCKPLLEVKEEVYDDDVVEMEVANQINKFGSGQNSSSIKDKSHARDRVLQRAKAFQSPNPHFMIIMRPSYVSTSIVSIPAEGRSYFRKKGSKIMYLSLKGGDGRVWSMKFKVQVPRSQVRIGYLGWATFQQENNLREGDICVFEVVNSANVEFKVTIFRTTDEEVGEKGSPVNAGISSRREMKEISNETQTMKRKRGVSTKECSTHLGRARGKLRSGQSSSSIKNKSVEISARDRVLQRAMAFQSQNPHFIVIMKQTYACRAYMHIPKGPATSYFPKTGNKNIKLSVQGRDGRVWTVKNRIVPSPNFRMMISSGWSKFMHENKLKVDDICVFELVNSRAKEFMVTIFRISEELVDKNDTLVARGKKKIPNERQTRKRKRSVSVKEYATPLQRANAFKCTEPTFTVIMRKSYTEDRFRLLIPKDHASRYLTDLHGQEISLHRHEGKTWPVIVRCCTSGYTDFSYGWKDFVIDNDLQVGDACVFQLLPHMANHYQVAIFRVGK